MDEAEAEKAYDGIAAILQNAGLEWVVRQVEESIGLGKTVTKKADASEFIEDAVVGERRGRRQMQDFMTSEPYSAGERLGLLLEAIQRIVALPEFEAETVSILKVEDVAFKSEGSSDGQGRSLNLARGVIQESARARLQEILLQVRGNPA